MSSKFFTNQDKNTLLNRLSDIFSYYDIKNIEFLIGYFRISGFKKIASMIGEVEKARVLVGINIDQLTLEAKKRGKEANLFDTKRITDSFSDEQADKIQKDAYSKEIEESVNLLAKLIKEQKIEIRISREKNIHAKIYILRANPYKSATDDEVHQKGAVITGSSNLSENGLLKNYEFNVELKDSDDISFALEEFEKLWISSIEICEEDIEQIKTKTYLKEITPYELYLKFLIEHFGERIDYDPTIADDLPKGFMKLAYQIDAVNEGLQKLRQHNGFFLSDVVGLGKTVTTAMLIKQLIYETKGEILIVAPPSIQKEWLETFKKFQIGSVRNYTFKSYMQLDKVKDAYRYETVIIDESHKFKNFATTAYKELERICKTKYTNKIKDEHIDKKIILISATPLNNRPQDIANQLYLFQDKRDSTIDSFSNLESFFAPIFKRYKEIISPKSNFNDDQIIIELKKITETIRENILREVMVRRTRTDIQTNERYKKDLLAQGIKIPKVNPVYEVEYLLDDKLAKIFSETIDILTEKLQYERYKILSKLNIQGQKKFGVSGNIFEQSAEQLSKIMQILLIKRFESSFAAFKSTIAKQKKHLENLIKMFEDDKILIPSKKIDIFSLIEEEDIEKIDEFVSEGKIKTFSVKDFLAPDDYLQALKKELVLLSELNDMWNGIDQDPKLDRFNQILKEQKDKKIVVFTESKQTAIYLEKKLKNPKLLVVHGENRDKCKDTIRENFDANYEDKKDDYDIIITTDTLSEGVNLHRSNIIYNYDIPWNSTRLMQRIGRINRIGTPHDEIFVYNFKPTAQSESLIELSKKAYIKLQTFHHTFGEDSKIYTKKEEIGTVELFEDSFEEANKELNFLEEIRRYKESYPQKFKALQNLPQKIRVQRENRNIKDQTFIFLKNNEHKSYLLVDENVKPINFLEMAEALKADKKENPITPMVSKHYDLVNKAVEQFEHEVLQNRVQEQKKEVKHRADRTAITKLKSWQEKQFISNELRDLFIKTVQNGVIQNLSREIVKITKEHEKELNKLVEKYALMQNDKKLEKDVKIDIVLSETFI